MRKLKLISVFLLSVFLLSCNRNVAKSDSDNMSLFSTFPDEQYQVMFEQYSRSIFRIKRRTSYITYYYNQNSMFLKKNLQKRDVEKNAVSFRTLSTINIGTGCLLKSNDQGCLLLTCAHVVSEQDTIYRFWPTDPNDTISSLYSISIKFSEEIFIPGISSYNSTEVVAIDSQSDIALLFVDIQQQIFGYRPVEFYLADPALARWGTKLYVAGFPSGRMMLTTSVLSQTNESCDHYLTDASFNEGYSGAPALLAIDSFPWFAVCGVISSVETDDINIIVPKDKAHQTKYNQFVPYTDEVFVDVYQEKRQGMTRVIKVREIDSLIITAKDAMAKYGFDSSTLFEKNRKIE